MPNAPIQNVITLAQAVFIILYIAAMVKLICYVAAGIVSISCIAGPREVLV